MIDNVESKVWYVYLIRTQSGTLYTGVTTDVDRRYKEHASGKQKSAKYLRGKGPLTLVWYQAVGKKETAMAIEYRMKRLKRVTKLALIEGSLSLEKVFFDIFEGVVLQA